MASFVSYSGVNSTLPIRSSPALSRMALSQQTAPYRMTLNQYATPSTAISSTTPGSSVIPPSTLSSNPTAIAGDKRKRQDDQSQDDDSSGTQAPKRRRKFPLPPGHLTRQELFDSHSEALEGEALLFVLMQFDNKDISQKRRSHHSTVSKAKERALIDRAALRNQTLQIVSDDYKKEQIQFRLATDIHRASTPALTQPIQQNTTAPTGASMHFPRPPSSGLAAALPSPSRRAAVIEAPRSIPQGYIQANTLGVASNVSAPEHQSDAQRGAHLDGSGSHITIEQAIESRLAAWNSVNNYPTIPHLERTYPLNGTPTRTVLSYEQPNLYTTQFTAYAIATERVESDNPDNISHGNLQGDEQSVALGGTNSELRNVHSQSVVPEAGMARLHISHGARQAASGPSLDDVLAGRATWEEYGNALGGHVDLLE